MDIHWLGHSCFRLRAAGATVLCDPFRLPAGPALPGQRADIVTISHPHPGHNHLAAVAGDPFVIDGPGEYEVHGVFIVGVPMAHDAQGGDRHGPSTSYCIDLEALTVCHLGDLGHVPTREQVEALGNVDVLLVPVGGGRTIGPEQAVDVVNLIEPLLIVPMHFRSVARPELQPVETFLRNMGLAVVEPRAVLQVAPGRLPSEPQVVLLQAEL